LLKASWFSKLKAIKSNNNTQWTTAAGKFETKYKEQAKMIFIELHETRTITCEAHIAPDLGEYDMIVGRDILKELGILFNFKDETIKWVEVVIPMKPETAKVEKHFHIANTFT
jgi:predicted aspartyl protease